MTDNQSINDKSLFVDVSGATTIQFTNEKSIVSSVLVIIAALNEGEGIGPTLKELKKFVGDPFLLVVDGNSIDSTVRIAREMGAHVLCQEGSGKGDAYATAIRYMKARNFEYAVFIDSDYTYPAQHIIEMIKILDKKVNVGMVCGNRFTDHSILRNMPWIFYIGNIAISYIHNLLNGVKLQDPLTGLRVVRWKILKGWEPKSKGFDVEVELNHYVENLDYKVVEIPIQYRARLGEKKLKPRHGLTIFKRILFESLT
jgi:glycosyltransferase involved in cell wall biosynthesis